MARRRKTKATDSLPVQTITPQASKQKPKQKPKDKMDAAGMKSWAQMLSGEKPALPKTFTDNLGAYAGPSKKNKRNRKGKKGPAAPTPAAQPLVAPTLSVPTPVVAIPTRPVQTLSPQAVRIPAAPIARTPVVPALPIVPIVRIPAVPVVPVARAQDNSAPVIPTPAIATPPRPASATPAPIIPTTAIPAVRTPAVPASQAQAVSAPVTPVPAAPVTPVPAAPVIPVPTAPVRIPTLWELYPAYSGKDLPQSKSHLGFRYNRDWVSFGVAPEHVAGLLQREFKRQRRAGLPPLYVDIADEHLEPLREVYSRAGELGLFNKRLAIRQSGQRRDAYPASYVFQTSLAEKANGTFLNNENPLVKFLRNPDFAMHILGKLKLCMRDIMSLATSCRGAAICVSENLEVWDSRRGELFFDDHFKGEEAGLRSHIVVVTPTESGLPVTASPYRNDFVVMNKLLRGMSDMRLSFRDIVLDKIPFLDCKVLEMMVNSMENLRTMGISNCLLLDVTKLEPILDIVHRHPIVSDREGDELYVQVDWQPFFFNGLNGLDTSQSPGSFGVTHNPPTFNIPKAVFGLIMKAMPLAKKVGMDLLSEGSSFWRFVRRLPGPDILWATKARDAIAVYELGPASITKDDKSIHVQTPKEAKNAFADDITAALSGDGVEPIEVPGRFNAASRELSFAFGYWRGERKCWSCEKMLLRTFFPIHTKVCWPCKMVQFVNTAESSHMRHRIQSALDFWTQGMMGYEFPTVEHKRLEDLFSAHRADKARNALRAAEDIDHAWFHHLANTTGPRGEEPLYPEPSNARPDAAWFRRSLMVRDKVFPKGDYREGGPQHEHPALLPIFPEMQTNTKTQGCEPYEHFCANWVYSDKSEALLAQFFLEAKDLTERWEGTIDHPRVQRYLAGARQSDKQQMKARELEWIAQNEANAIWYMMAMADVEDCVISKIGPGPRSWNRDKVKDAERALEPMNLFGEYMGKNNFQV